MRNLDVSSWKKLKLDPSEGRNNTRRHASGGPEFSSTHFVSHLSRSWRRNEEQSQVLIRKVSLWRKGGCKLQRGDAYRSLAIHYRYPLEIKHGTENQLCSYNIYICYNNITIYNVVRWCSIEMPIEFRDSQLYFPDLSLLDLAVRFQLPSQWFSSRLAGWARTKTLWHWTETRTRW